MPDERYAPPQAPIRDVAHERALAQRPRQVKVALGLIALSWLLDFPPAYHLYVHGAQWTLLVALEGAVMVLLLGLGYAMARGRNWARITYLLLTALLLTLSVTTDSEPRPIPAYVSLCTLLSNICAMAPLALLFFGPGGQWFRLLRQ